MRFVRVLFVSVMAFVVWACQGVPPEITPQVQPGGTVVDAGGALPNGHAVADAAVRRATALSRDQAAAVIRARYPDSDAAGIESHLQGIDFTRPVESVELKAGDCVDMWVRDGGRPGAYATTPGTTSGLGISMDSVTGRPLGRHLERYELTSDATVMRSTAADFDSGKIAGVGGKGGGTQYFLPADFFSRVKRVQ